ncbi:M14 family metallopeptidase [Arenicella xantha]|uniref:Succinylglutamate desuccinylase/aspartoacylase family protein n=1 Tax=Arenicella xantha TaxID=644221 RepID=A0A395JHJ7_9GAMM|nr:M14 family metallocarboxypeptidase [Arenicella xantha]RBP47109.1 succinylglutamate desuccinylase/aspartoacylase family protein [Arenicella xantha]
MNEDTRYAVGQPGKPWASAERGAWLAMQSIQRQYADEVLAKLSAVDACLTVEQYGALSYDPDRYPLFAAKSSNWQCDKPVALITGGVHGYETSGVQGALRFLVLHAPEFSQQFNLIIAPCISPWAYETINRWNPYAIDPNRSFEKNSPSQEAAALMAYVNSITDTITLHIDLHETTDTDNSEFRPALAARDNVEHAIWDIPDGFYLVGDSENPRDAFQAEIIAAVEAVTHIAPSDEDGRIIGERITQPGVINYAVKDLSLCTGFSDADFCTTTEVYPDSPLVDDENCIQAQVAAVIAALRYVYKQL